MTADRDADFAALYQAHYPTVLLVMRGYLLPMDAEDAAQETFVRAWTHWPPAHDELERWLFAIARSVLVDAIRRRTRRAAYVFPMEHDFPLEADRDFVTDDVEDTVLAALERSEQRRVVSVAAAGLTAHQRAGLRKWLSGCSYAEAGAQLGIGENAYRSLLHRARVFVTRRAQQVVRR